MKIHPRYWIVETARAKLGLQIAQFMNETDETEDSALTVNEWLQVLNDVFHAQIGSIIKYEIREERHGDPNKKGDVAYEQEEQEN